MLCDRFVAAGISSSSGIEVPSADAIAVQNFFESTHDLWCTEQVIGGWATRAKAKPSPKKASSIVPVFENEGQLPNIVQTKIAEAFSREGTVLCRLVESLNPLFSDERDLIHFIIGILMRVCSLRPAAVQIRC